MVMPSMPIPTRASLTSSILCGWMIASIFFMLSALFLRCEVCHDAEHEGRLARAVHAVFLGEVGFVGPVVPELAAGEQPALELVIRRECNFLDVLNRAGGESVRILEEVQAAGDRCFGGRL